MVCLGMTGIIITILTLALSSVLAAGGEKNRTRVTDPLQRVMLEFNLYQVRQRGREGGREREVTEIVWFAGRGGATDEAAG